MPTSILANVIFITFTLLATIGLYLAVAHFRTRRLALALALAALLFFLALHRILTHLAAAYAPL